MHCSNPMKKNPGKFHLLKPLQEWIKIPFEDHPPKKCLFRVDAGNYFGLSFGHLSRCLILAKVFKEIFDSECLFLMKDFNEGIQQAIISGIQVKKLPKNVTYRYFISKFVLDYKPDCLIVDLPYPDENMSIYIELKKYGVKFFFIDDNRYHNPGADVYLNSQLLAHKKLQQNKLNNTIYFLGPEYFIFDETLIEKTFPIPENDCFNIVLSFGGSDPTNLMMKTVKELVNTQYLNNRYYIILGPGYMKQSALKTIIDKYDNFFLVHNPENIIPYFQSSDFVICAGGRTIYELLYLKKNFMPIASAPHETDAISELFENNLIQYGMKQWSPKEFVSNLKKIVKKEHYASS